MIKLIYLSLKFKSIYFKFIFNVRVKIIPKICGRFLLIIRWTVLSFIATFMCTTFWSLSQWARSGNENPWNNVKDNPWNFRKEISAMSGSAYHFGCRLIFVCLQVVGVGWRPKWGGRERCEPTWQLSWKSGWWRNSIYHRLWTLW